MGGHSRGAGFGVTLAVPASRTNARAGKAMMVGVVVMRVMMVKLQSVPCLAARAAMESHWA
jgi:hypothetical protein